MVVGSTCVEGTLNADGAEVKAPVTTTAAALKRLRTVFIMRLPRLRDLLISYSLIAVDTLKKQAPCHLFK